MRSMNPAAGLIAIVLLSAYPTLAVDCVDYALYDFLVGYVDTLRMELSKQGCTGVKTLCVCPSGIDTGMFPGYKAPLISPLLKPEEVARRTLKSISMNWTYLKLPFIVKCIPSMKLFPARVQDVMARATGLLSSMDHFTAKK